jgi:hypothetical protein
VYLIQHLREAGSYGEVADEKLSEVEYRLICSGTLFPSGFLSDWTKSTVARLLLPEPPFILIVASEPYEAYPQELVLRFFARQVTEKTGTYMSIFRPDREIATDLASILTLFTRRLITVACRVRETFSGRGIPEVLRDYPNPITSSPAPHVWRERPITVRYGYDGVDYKPNQPPPVAFDAGRFLTWLERLPHVRARESIVRTAQQYALALELIETRIEIAYQMIISAIETAAGASLSGWSPDVAEQLITRQALTKFAKKKGIAEDLAKELALESCKGNPWSKRKFTKFLMDNANIDDWETEDTLFPVPGEFQPSKVHVEKALSEVYSIRSGATHEGRPYPPEAAIGPSMGIPFEAMASLFSGEPVFPPIGWFERVAHSAICRWIDTELISKGQSNQGS